MLFRSVAQMNDQQRTQMVTSLAGRNWGELNSLEKELLGKPTDPKITQAWEQLRIWMAEARQRLQPGESLPNNTEDAYANTIAKVVPGFKQDRVFSQLPLAQRLQRFPQIAPPDNKNLWNELLSAAAGRYAGMKANGWKRGDIATFWQQKDVPQINEWLAQNPAFAKEIKAMGTDFVWNLVS